MHRGDGIQERPHSSSSIEFNVDAWHVRLCEALALGPQRQPEWKEAQGHLAPTNAAVRQTQWFVITNVNLSQSRLQVSKRCVAVLYLTSKRCGRMLRYYAKLYDSVPWIVGTDRPRVLQNVGVQSWSPTVARFGRCNYCVRRIDGKAPDGMFARRYFLEGEPLCHRKQYRKQRPASQSRTSSVMRVSRGYQKNTCTTTKGTTITESTERRMLAKQGLVAG